MSRDELAERRENKMHSAWSMTAVTFILKGLLENALIGQAGQAGLGEVLITALPPDRIALGAEERPQLNLYLYRLTPDSSWRQNPAGERAGAGSESVQADRQPLALKLHYLLSAYGERDGQAELLLGLAIDCLQQAALLADERLQSLLQALSLDGTGTAQTGVLTRLASAAPLRALRIRPEFLSMEEQTRLWSAWQAHARLAMAYEVAVLLNEAQPERRGRA
ncbi:MAG: DUF4255 domain-containing protein [Thermogemmatispora sp.]|uniref:DUF4255 domain-containing protein n=1 Tax=Thermogemmatispora TaxID=768669 RepID=UPI00124C4554|nr:MULTISPECIES: DUF4255 domain-containing protein [Thermogemmatispora]MBE3565045.1 DUF4255 domain-containing protein [Thermogemmatispora sp.]GER84086.1 hypothetical protein KTAU_27230 [Thermogemmatispora aurantia]